MTPTRLATKAAVVVAAVLGAQIAAACPSLASPADDFCSRGRSFLCRFVPIAPDLDGDVDLTTHLPPVDPAAPAPE